jgi:regulator of sigma D
MSDVSIYEQLAKEFLAKADEALAQADSIRKCIERLTLALINLEENVDEASQKESVKQIKQQIKHLRGKREDQLDRVSAYQQAAADAKAGYHWTYLVEVGQK